jgi:hypothetical protein
MTRNIRPEDNPNNVAYYKRSTASTPSQECSDAVGKKKKKIKIKSRCSKVALKTLTSPMMLVMPVKSATLVDWKIVSESASRRHPMLLSSIQPAFAGHDSDSRFVIKRHFQ